jgi:hypothetical protein
MLLIYFNRRHSDPSCYWHQVKQHQHHHNHHHHHHHRVRPVWFNYLETFTSFGLKRPSSGGAQHARECYIVTGLCNAPFILMMVQCWDLLQSSKWGVLASVIIKKKNYCHIFHTLKFWHVYHRLSYTHTQNYVKNVEVPLLCSKKMKSSYDIGHTPI